MFNHFKLFFILLISLSLISSVSPLYAQSQNQKQNIEDYEKHLESMRVEAQKLSIQLMVAVPMREGRDRVSYASGFAIFKNENELEDFGGRIIKYTSYYILSCIHIVSEKQPDLEDYEKDNIRIWVLGKDNNKAQAKIVAWEWGCDSLLLRVDIPEKELDKFKIHIAKIANKLPTSMQEARYSDEAVPTVYFSGYPGAEPGSGRGYIREYYWDYSFNEYTRFIKAATVGVEGVSGGGQSGSPVLNRSLEVVGTWEGGPQYLGSNLGVIITIDVIVERFLKNLVELKGLTLPKFQLEKWIENKPVFIGRPKNSLNN